MNKLNARQDTLYKFLKKKNEKFTQYQIATILSDFYDFDKEIINEKNFHDSGARLRITNDIRAINDSDVEDIIVSDATGIYIADPETAQDYIDEQFKQAFRKLEVVRHKQDKIKDKTKEKKAVQTISRSDPIRRVI